MTTQAEVDDALLVLGDTPTKVFRRLAARGFKGEPGKHNQCPVALYLKDCTGAYEVRVTRQDATVQAEEIDYQGSWQDFMEQVERVRTWASLPRPVSVFVDLFDNGHFPSLVS